MGPPLPSLDLSTSGLTCGDRQTRLRPKDFAVLRHLVAHSGRLLDKQALIDACWPGLFVTDAVLKACINRLRAALGDSPAAPRFIQTVPKRGYRFIGDIAITSGDVDRNRGTVSGIPASVGRSVTVGRQEELARLAAASAAAAAGRRQVVFVTGEAGIGKTALLRLFLDTHVSGDALIAHGQCVEEYGPGEAFMPLVEALASLCRGPRRTVATHLVRLAPGWLAQMPAHVPPGEAESVRRRALGVTRARMMRELCDALDAITADAPLVVVIEDVHWSDASTLEAIATLARAREPARLLVLCTYRPEDVLPGEHPLPAVARELRMRRLVSEVRLAPLSADSVGAYLAARFPGAEMSPRIVRAVHRRTDGHPLFLAALTDHWIASQWVVQRDSGWSVTASPESLDAHVPDDVRQMLDARLDRLTATDRRLVEAASISGTSFCAASVAAAGGGEVVDADEACAALARREYLLVAEGSEAWPDGTVSGRYRFTHALYRETIYQQVPAARRRVLHERVARREESAFGDEAPRIAPRLAMHFSMAGDHATAVRYHTAAARSALSVGGYQEGAVHAAAGLDALSMTPDAGRNREQELALQLLRGAAISAAQGFAADAAERAFARARELSRDPSNAPHSISALAGLYAFHLMRGPVSATRDVAEEMRDQSRRIGSEPGAIWAAMALGVERLQAGALRSARAHFEDVLVRYDSHPRRTYASIHPVDPKLAALGYLSWTLWLLGFPDDALARGRQGLTLVSDGLPVDRAHGLVLQAHLHLMREEPALVAECAGTALDICVEYGLEQYLSPAMIARGWARAISGETAAGLEELQHGIRAWGDAGAQYAQSRHYALLAEVRSLAGDLPGARAALDEAMTIVTRTGERFWEPEIHRLRAELHLRSAGAVDGVERGAALREARDCCQSALDLARQQDAQSLERRAAVTRDRLTRLDAGGPLTRA